MDDRFCTVVLAVSGLEWFSRSSGGTTSGGGVLAGIFWKSKEKVKSHAGYLYLWSLTDCLGHHINIYSGSYSSRQQDVLRNVW